MKALVGEHEEKGSADLAIDFVGLDAVREPT
jgi:hypothetical protein